MSKNLPHTNSSSFKIHHKTCMKSFIFQDIFKEEVSDAIASIKSSSAPGIDEITPKFVKIAKGILSPILAKLFTKCIHQETFPSDFKVGYVIPIPKTSSPKSLDEFRPISLLSVFSKLFEKILKIKMLKFNSKNNILTPFQCGFRENNSTELAITAFYDKLLKNLNENKITCSIFLDLRKAFDSVNHSILLKKLYHYGFRGKIYELLTSYLADRQIMTKINDKKSAPRIIDHGVPQGSVLGPLLFLIYVNDLPSASNLETTLFADDTNLHLSHHNIITLKSQVQLEIDKINNWMISNKLTINYKKSYYMIVGNTKSVDKAKFNLTINHNLIKKSEFVKYLGVFLDDKLSWKIHIEKICQKLSRVCGMMYKLRYYVPLSTRKLVYFSLFHSQLQYSLLNWGRAAKSNLQKLVILQNKILRASLFRPKHHQTTLLYSEFGVLTLENMINMEFAKFMYKVNNKMLPESFNNYFTKLDDVHKYKTRQKHRNEFFQLYIASKTGQKSLRHICINVWKNVPTEYRQCSFFKFKRYFKSNALLKYNTSVP